MRVTPVQALSGPMVEAALPLLERLGVAQKRIFYDKFTTTGDAGDPEVLEEEAR